MKYAALKRGAELAPISCTGGMDLGRGVVSTRMVRSNLEIGVSGSVLVMVFARVKLTLAHDLSF